MRERLYLYNRRGSGPASIWATSIEEARQRIEDSQAYLNQRFNGAGNNFPFIPNSLRPATEDEKDNLYARMAAQFGG